jgi:hypothetical protein
MMETVNTTVLNVVVLVIIVTARLVADGELFLYLIQMHKKLALVAMVKAG